MPRERERWLTQDLLKSLLHYDRDTGVFTWTKTAKAGRVAGTSHNEGYWHVTIRQRQFLAHRLAWLYVYGVWPTNDVDHMNGKRNDNRIANLREATRSENLRNTGKRQSNKSGFKGVSFCRETGRWSAIISVDYKSIRLGRFATPEEAHAAYVAAAERLHGEFARAA